MGTLSSINQRLKAQSAKRLQTEILVEVHHSAHECRGDCGVLENLLRTFTEELAEEHKLVIHELIARLSNNIYQHITTSRSTDCVDPRFDGYDRTVCPGCEDGHPSDASTHRCKWQGFQGVSNIP